MSACFNKRLPHQEFSVLATDHCWWPAFSENQIIACAFRALLFKLISWHPNGITVTFVSRSKADPLLLTNYPNFIQQKILSMYNHPLFPTMVVSLLSASLKFKADYLTQTYHTAQYVAHSSIYILADTIFYSPGHKHLPGAARVSSFQLD